MKQSLSKKERAALAEIRARMVDGVTYAPNSELASPLGISRPYVTGLITRLVEKGYLTREITLAGSVPLRKLILTAKGAEA